MINKIGSGVNVDNLYHERVASVYNICPIYGYVPLVPTTRREENESFKHFYDFICNSDRHPGPRSLQADTFDRLSEEAQLQIILKIRQENLGVTYTYMPTHLLQGELCMVLQTKTFESQKNLATGSTIVTEIDNDSHKRHDARTTRVHEIAFGPVGDVTVRTVSIWFDVSERDLVPCTSQQAKHHKRSRHRLNKKGKNKLKIDENTLTLIPPFNHYQPRDETTYDLITSILMFRLKTISLLKNEGRETSGREKQQIVHELETEMETIKFRFYNLLRYWVVWSWPDQVLDTEIDDDTDVPPVDGEYLCLLDVKSRYQRISANEFHGLGAKRGNCYMPLERKRLPAFIWKSFIQNIQIMQGQSIKTVSAKATL